MRQTPARLASGWGAAWGVALGFWILAPRLLQFCHLHPASWIDWWRLDLVLFESFALLGTIISFFGCGPLVLAEALRSRPLRDRSLAYGVAVALLLPLAYFGLILVVDGLTRGPLRSAEPYPRMSLAAILLSAAALVLLLAYHRRFEAWRLRRVVLATAVAGIVLLPLYAPPSGRSPPAATEPLRPSATRNGPTSPILFVGIDSANWRTMQPLLDRGSLPTFQRLRNTGLHGNIIAIWPPYWSAPAWAAIVTGWGQNETGIHEDLAIEVPSIESFEIPLRIDFVLQPFLWSALLLAHTPVLQIAPARRELLGRPPFWELVASAGVKSAVVRFPFTYPANGQADYIVSDRVGEDLWAWVGMRAEGGPGAVWPPGDSQALLEPFTGALLATEFDGLRFPAVRHVASDASVDPIAVLERAARIDEQTAKAAQRIVRMHPEVSVTSVYLGGFDSICHAFWQYRFPEDFRDRHPPPQADIAAFGPAIDLYWKFLDRSLAETIAAFPEAPNVVVVADHGAERNQDNLLWRGWHSAKGAIFLAAGPDVPHRDEALRVSYFDVAPTLLDLLGFEKPSGLIGRSRLR